MGQQVRNGAQTQRAGTRRRYLTPRLVEYGAVRELTAGGSGKASESQQGQAKPRP
jgi:hypothetical protein